MFKSKIEGRASEGLQETDEKWLKYVKEKGLLVNQGGRGEEVSG